RQRRLTNTHRARRQIVLRHRDHPGLDRAGREIVERGEPAGRHPHEFEKPPQIPSVGRDTSVGSPAQLAPVGAELLDQFVKRWVHGSSPPARATTPFSLLRSIGRADPPVKRDRPASRWRARAGGGPVAAGVGIHWSRYSDWEARYSTG